MDESVKSVMENPGAHLAALRQKQGYSQEYVAGKLHLRTHLIELLETDNYQRLPQPVFVQGYIRAYCKLLDIDAESLVHSYISQYAPETKCERALWQQTKREPARGEKMLRWFTVLFALGVMIAVGMWWQKNKEAQDLYSNKDAEGNMMSMNQTSPEIRLTDLSRMQSLLSTNPQLSPMEKQGE
jgi:cytoskeleton protein RodZ